MTKVLNGAAMAASKVEHKGQALLWQDARGGGHWDETTGISNGRCPFEKEVENKTTTQYRSIFVLFIFRTGVDYSLVSAVF